MFSTSLSLREKYSNCCFTSSCYFEQHNLREEYNILGIFELKMDKKRIQGRNVSPLMEVCTVNRDKELTRAKMLENLE